MKLNTFRKLRIILLVLVAAGVFASIYLNFVILAAFSVGLGMVVMSFLKILVKDVIEDERIEEVHEKATRASFKILMPILGLTAITLFYAGDGPFYFLRSLGIILAYVTCVGLVVYLIAYFYFNRKYGG